MNFIKKVFSSYIFLLIISFAIGFSFNSFFSGFYDYNLLFLQIIFFLSSLKIDPKEFLIESKKIKEISWVNVLVLIILPILFYYLFKFTIPEIAIPAMLLMIVPVAKTAPLLTSMIGGNTTLATIITTITSFVSILSIPTIIYFTLGNSVNINYFSILEDILSVILIPFMLAQIIRFIFKNKVEKSFKLFNPISTFILILILTSILAHNKELLISSFNILMIRDLIILFIIFIALHFFGYLISLGTQNKKDKLAIMVTSVYMNFTLSIYICHKFFPNENVVFLILAMIPWALVFPIFQYFVNKKGERLA